MTVFIDSHPSAMFGFSLEGWKGRNPALFTLDMGDETRFSVRAQFKPVDRLIIEPTLDYVRSEHAGSGELLFEQTITRARIRYQFNPRLSLRLVVQHNGSDSPPFQELAVAGNFDRYHLFFGDKWEVDPLLTYRINSFSVFYLGSTHDWRDFNAAYDDRSSLQTMTDRQFFTKFQYLFQI